MGLVAEVGVAVEEVEGGFAGADEEVLVLRDVGDFEVGQAALAGKVCVRLRAFACSLAIILCLSS